MQKEFRLLVTSSLLMMEAMYSGAQVSHYKVNIHLSKASIVGILNEISTTNHVTFLYDARIIPDNIRISYQAQNDNLTRVLADVLTPFGLQYQIVNNTVVITPASRKLERILKGIVTNAKTNEPLIGVTIRLKGSNAAVATDATGSFSLRISDENAVLVVSYIGFETQEISVGARTQVAIKLVASQTLLNEVVVQARRRTNTEVTVLKERKNSSVVSDAISAQQIEKTASITTVQALQRVTGVTITDDKYVAIRGLGDRAVVAELNGIRLSSSNPDRSSPPLDLVPAALLDNVTVYKTLNPDRPADAAAGIIELKTRSVPDSLTVSFTAQAGFNSSIGLGGYFNAFQGADLGYFGQRVSDHNISPSFGALGTQYPGGLDQIRQEFIESRHSLALASEAYRINKIEDQFSPILTASYQKANPNQIYTATFGDSYKTFRGQSLGIIISANYYQRYEDLYQGQRNQYSIFQGIVTGSPIIFNTLHIPNNVTPDNVQLSPAITNKESSGTETINYGILTGLTYRFNPRNEISAQYLASRGAEATGRNITGSYDNTGLNYPVLHSVNQLSQSYRIFNTFNLQGEHKFLNKPWSPQLSYNGSFSRSNQNEPDFRSTEVAEAEKPLSLSQIQSGLLNPYYVFVIGTAHGINANGGVTYPPSNGRFFRKLNENNYNFKADLSQPFTLLGQKQLVKVGANYLKRDRDFIENELDIPGVSYGPIPTSASLFRGATGLYDNGQLNVLHGNTNALVSYANIGLQPSQSGDLGQPRFGGFLYNSKKSPNNYKGYYQVRAYYAMLDLHLTRTLRATGGVRWESTDIRAFVDTVGVINQQTLSTGPSSINPVVTPNTSYQVAYKPYYSVNVIYALHNDMNFRFAYNTALARPELREITNIFEYDPFQFAVISGNPGLRNQFNRNYDFRWEIFPKPGEVLAASIFYKQIFNQLTKTYTLNTLGNASINSEYPIIRFTNDPNEGKVYGLELEARKSLSSFWWPLKYFFIGTNLLLDRSVVTKNADRYRVDRFIDRYSPPTSPVFEQAPYSVNAYLDYDNVKTGSNFTIVFNEVGERLVQVQLDGTPDLYDRPVPLLDAVFSQHFWKRFTVKGFAKNILNPTHKTVYTIPGNDGSYRGNTYINRSYKRGAEFSLGLTYNLF